MSSAIALDGGEGGGQLVRTALTLSLATGRPFSLESIRARRVEPGLTPALVACVRAAEALSGARVEGAHPGSPRLLFEPGALRAGSYLLDAGPRGSVALLLQTLAVPLALAGAPSTLRLTGRTHVEGAPAMPYLSWIWLPVLRELGHDLDVELKAAGWAPESGGEVTVSVRPARPATPLERRTRGTLREARVLTSASNVPFEVARALSERVQQRLRESGVYADAENVPVRAPTSKGLCCLVVAAFERGRAGFTALASGELDAPGAADAAAEGLSLFMRSRAAVDEHLADQLLVPAALAAAGLQGGARVVSRLAAPRASEHLLAAAGLVARFLDVEAAVLAGDDDAPVEIRIAPREEGLMAALRERGRS